jgi:hypothetical protein
VPRERQLQLLFYALNQSDLDTRVVEALPWLTFTYVNMDWNWLLANAKVHDSQNRLGFVVELAGRLANKAGDISLVKELAEYRSSLLRSQVAQRG